MEDILLPTPNRFLSKMAAWKKDRANMMAFSSPGREQPSIRSSSRRERERRRLAFSPLGGSLATLIHAWRRDVGRDCSSDGGGSAESSNLKSG